MLPVIKYQFDICMTLSVAFQYKGRFLLKNQSLDNLFNSKHYSLICIFCYML